MIFLKAFIVGGLICVVGQILIDKTKLTAGRVLVGFVVAGVVLGAFGLFEPLESFAGTGATVPLLGFGATLAKGAIEGAKKAGFLGVLQGGLTATAGGIAVAIVSAFLVGLIFNSRTKHLK